MDWIAFGKRWYPEFKDSGACAPGVQIELADGRRFLIGDVNPLGGVCDDCPGFDSRSIIVRYRRLVSPEQLTAK